ncbi:cytochrome c [Novosphingobium sp. CF614]|uniref:c-type cytochrome n=1 Tax=Novosphingobium sp. CF614 TaxID=1884364 RepID=UPI0008E01814|nr:c-type cytochrome [Novosphingobium sp. CF614]SFF79352.1 cytochrome c [Novosphingobium sp. CF614]
MDPRNLTVVLPLALLAACGGSGPGEQAGETASPAATSEAAPVQAPVQAEVAAPPSPTDSSSPTESVAAATSATPPPAFATCRACHSVEPAKNGVGPTLFGIVGSKAGEVPGYAFSPALKASGITWDRASLDTWLQGPMKMVPGTRMVIAVPNAEARKAIINYLETAK